MDFFLDALQDTLGDTVNLVPFLFVTYLFMEYLEHHTGSRVTAALSRIGRAGPVFGGLFGVVPQCGFSASAASLYAGGVISVGTLLAVFLSTSDEMLPIFISEQVAPSRILSILGLKAVLGIISGFAVDAFLRRVGGQHAAHSIHELCEEAHCDCGDKEENIVKAAAVHTLEITVFIFIISLLLAMAVDGLGEETLAGFLRSIPTLGVFLAALIGLIPNCGASVAITQLYLTGLLSTGQMMAGLLVSAGVGLLVLFRTNRHHLTDNLKILAILYGTGVFWGLVLEMMGVQL